MKEFRFRLVCRDSKGTTATRTGSIKTESCDIFAIGRELWEDTLEQWDAVQAMTVVSFSLKEIKPRRAKR